MFGGIASIGLGLGASLLGDALGGDSKAQTSSSAQDAYTNLVRNQWDDYRKRFYPFEDKLYNLVMDKEQNQQLHNQALGYVDQAGANALGRLQGGLLANDRRYGVQLGADEQQARNTLLLNAAAAQQSGAKTRMRGFLADRDLTLINGGV